MIFLFIALKAVLKLVIVSLVSFHFPLSHPAAFALLSGSQLASLYIAVCCLILSSFISCFMVLISLSFYCKEEQSLSKSTSSFCRLSFQIFQVCSFSGLCSTPIMTVYTLNVCYLPLHEEMTVNS